MTVKVGWDNDNPLSVKVFTGDERSVLDACAHYVPECFVEDMPLEEMLEARDYINSEGNYHELIFEVVESDELVLVGDEHHVE